MIRNTHLSQLINVLLSLVIFLAPTNLFFNLTEQYAYITGLRSDYLIPKLYLTDVVMLTTVFTFLYINRKKILDKNNYTQQHLGLICFIVILLVQQLISPLPAIGVWTLFSWIVTISCAYIAHKRKFFSSQLFIWSMLVTLFFQSGVGIIQFIAQKQIAGFYFLGETNLLNFSGIAKTTLFGVEKISPYGTTAHPNILAGYLVVYSLFVLLSKSVIKHKILSKLIVLLSIICTALTASFSAFLTGSLGLLIYISNKLQIRISSLQLATVAISIITTVPVLLVYLNTQTNHQSIERRILLNSAAIKLIIENPFGVGLSQFVNTVENYSQSSEIVRFLQPVHHALLLALAEVGLMQLVALTSFTFYIVYKQEVKFEHGKTLLIVLLIFAPIIALDHYVWSLEPGRVLLTITIAYIISNPTIALSFRPKHS